MNRCPSCGQPSPEYCYGKGDSELCFKRATEPVPVTLTREKWDSVTGSISAAHSEYCISSDNCDCTDLSQKISEQLP